MDPPVDLSSSKPARRFVPTSWKTFFHRWRRRRRRRRRNWTLPPSSLEASSFPPSPDSEEDVEMMMMMEKVASGPSPPASSSPPPVYEAREASFGRKYSYLRSSAGLLRLLSGLELLLGGLVFACVAAYVQKDDQWNQLYRSSFAPYNGLYGYGGYYGPMSPFVLAVAGLAWLLTLLLLGLGLTTYHRVILLRARWWPPTEAGLHLLMALLSLAAGLAYLNGVRRGGLCYTALAYNPLLGELCRVGGGQVAALLFLFLNAGLYFAGALVGILKRRRPQPPLLPVTPRPLPPSEDSLPAAKVTRRVEFSEEAPKALSGAIPTGHAPRPHLVPDYVLKYPAIATQGEREKYKAVFTDQYAEYKELYGEVRAAQRKFREWSALMRQLPRRCPGGKEQSRLSAVWTRYRNKKEDPAFWEKQERCHYLQRKLAHLKAQIQAFDREPSEEEASVHL